MEIAGGGVVTELEPPPHPTRPEIMAAQMSGRRTQRLIVTCKSPYVYSRARFPALDGRKIL
jgi:hypothetical protein